MDRYQRLLYALIPVMASIGFFRFILTDNTSNKISACVIAIAAIGYVIVMLHWTPEWDNPAIAAFFLVVGLSILYGGTTARNLDLIGSLGYTQRAIFRSFLMVGSLLGVYETARWGIRKAKIWRKRGS